MVATFFGSFLLLPLVTSTYKALEAWEDHFEHSTYLDFADTYKLYWNILDDEVEIGLEVETLGWIGWGLSPTGAMTNADIIMAWIEDDGTPVLQNRYTENARTTPTLMTDQSNINLIEAFRNDNKLYFHFTRLIHPCSDHTLFVPTGTSRIIFAWNNALPINGQPAQHQFLFRGTKSINLLVGETSPVPMPPDVEYFDLLMDSYQVPSDDTTYYCQLLELPTLTDIHHMIRIDPIVQPGNEGIVHHIVLFGCPSKYVEDEDVGMGEVCDDFANMPTEAAGCLLGSIFAAWVVGGGDFYFPEHVGYELGGGEENALQYAVIQMHYDNPFERADVLDSSGFRIYYTPTLREYSAEMLTVGAVSNPHAIFVPPQVDFANFSGVCSAECTQALVPEEGVYAFSNFLHGHIITRALKLRHIRGNQELPVLDRNDAYDFDYQQMWILSEERHILPGDQLLLECIYDSEGTDYLTWGGESTRHEMCLSFVYVYPKTAFEGRCTSAWTEINWQQFWAVAVARGYATREEILNYDSYTYDASTPEAREYYNSFIDIVETSARIQFCGGFGADPIPIDINTDFEAYPDDKYCDSTLFASNSQNNEGNAGFEWNAWYGYLIETMLVCVVLSCLLYGCWKMMKTKNRKIGTENLHPAVPLIPVTK